MFRNYVESQKGGGTSFEFLSLVNVFNPGFLLDCIHQIPVIFHTKFEMDLFSSHFTVGSTLKTSLISNEDGNPSRTPYF
uniref:Uncharacterized protein n=1 Tax=Caenorhabditis tropicalis TaxID=1561998 RepID=A0A1I7UTU8_9PELO